MVGRKKKSTASRKTTARVDDKPVVITLDAVITLGELANLRDKILEHAEAREIEIDASKVEHIDTGGIQLLLSIANSFKKRGGKIIWKGWSTPCVSTAELLGMTKILEMNT